MTISCRLPPAFSYRDSVTRFTANILPLRERVSRRATLAPCPIGLPGLPWRYAPVVSHLPQCATSLPDSTFAQCARTHQRRSLSRRSPSSAFPRIAIGQSSLAMNDRAEVCPLSRQAMFQPASRPLQPGMLFRHSFPQRQQRSLQFACRCRRPYGLTLFRMNLRARRTLPLRRRLIVHGGPVFKDHSSPRTVLVQACQHVWLVQTHDVYRKFTYIARTRSSLAPLRLRTGRFCVPCGSAHRISGGYVVPRTSHRAITGSARPGRERLMEQPVSSGHTCSCETETHATFRSYKNAFGDI
jgi:hypothetical protein